MLLCVLGLGVGLAGITSPYGVSEVWAAPKGMAFGLLMSEKGVNFWTEIGCVFHPGLALGILFTKLNFSLVVKLDVLFCFNILY